VTNSEPVQADEAAKRAQRVLGQDHERLRSISLLIQRSASDGSAIASALEELRAALVEHFAREEHSQAIEAVLGSKSSAEAEGFAEILAEHASILANVEELVSQARTGTAVPAGLAAQAAMLASFLGDHERREDQALKAILASLPGPGEPQGSLSADSPRS